MLHSTINSKLVSQLIFASVFLLYYSGIMSKPIHAKTINISSSFYKLEKDGVESYIIGTMHTIPLSIEYSDKVETLLRDVKYYFAEIDLTQKCNLDFQLNAFFDSQTIQKFQSKLSEQFGGKMKFEEFSKISLRDAQKAIVHQVIADVLDEDFERAASYGSMDNELIKLLKEKNIPVCFLSESCQQKELIKQNFLDQINWFLGSKQEEREVFARLGRVYLEEEVSQNFYMDGAFKKLQRIVDNVKEKLPFLSKAYEANNPVWVNKLVEVHNSGSFLAFFGFEHLKPILEELESKGFKVAAINLKK